MKIKEHKNWREIALFFIFFLLLLFLIISDDHYEDNLSCKPTEWSNIKCARFIDFEPHGFVLLLVYFHIIALVKEESRKYSFLLVFKNII